MEKFIEGTIDKGLESIASGLYFFSFIFGIALVLLGVLLLFNRKDPKKNITNMGTGLSCNWCYCNHKWSYPDEVIHEVCIRHNKIGICEIENEWSYLKTLFEVMIN